MPTQTRVVSDLEDAAAALRAGGLAVVPTETVFGLAADATNGDAVARIFDVKGRPRFNPLIAHAADAAAAWRLARPNDAALTLAERFWPGPLTLVLPLADTARLHPLATAGLDSVALRVARGPMTSLAAMLDRPLAAPSANVSGRVSPTRIDHVLADLAPRLDPATDAILAGGTATVGVESTIVSLVGEAPVLLRPGGLARAEIEAALGRSLIASAADGAVTAPGMLASHYAPRGSVRLDATRVEDGEFLIAFGPAAPPGRAIGTFQLSRTGDLAEAARNLFAALHAANAAGADRIAVQAIPRTGLGEAINDRLRRASAPRDGGTTAAGCERSVTARPAGSPTRNHPA